MSASLWWCYVVWWARRLRCWISAVLCAFVCCLLGAAELSSARKCLLRILASFCDVTFKTNPFLWAVCSLGKSLWVLPLSLSLRPQLPNRGRNQQPLVTSTRIECPRFRSRESYYFPAFYVINIMFLVVNGGKIHSPSPSTFFSPTAPPLSLFLLFRFSDLLSVIGDSFSFTGWETFKTVSSIFQEDVISPAFQMLEPEAIHAWVVTVAKSRPHSTDGHSVFATFDKTPVTEKEPKGWAVLIREPMRWREDTDETLERH